MNALAFDTHRFVKCLTAAGFTETQAEVLAEEQARLIDERLTTKKDLTELETRIDSRMAKREARLEARLVKWMLATMAGQAALIVTLLKWL